MRLAFDIEANGLLNTLTKAFCIGIVDVDSLERYLFPPSKLNQGIQMLTEADLIIAHNGIAYDDPALRLLFDGKYQPKKVFDTLVAARVVYSDVGMKQDIGLIKKYLRTNGKEGLPPQFKGRHSLEAWGYRLGKHKNAFKPENYGLTWETIEYTDEMGEYVVDDADLCADIFRRIEKRKYPRRALKLEHDMAWLMAKQERNGFKFDEQAACQLHATLSRERAELDSKLITTFGCWYEPDKTANKDKLPETNIKVCIPKRTLNYTDPFRASRIKGVPFTAIKRVEFNPGSRQHIAKRLIKKYGWTPAEFTDKGSIKVDEEVLSKLPYPEARLASQYLTVRKLLGQLSEGENAWLKSVRNGYIHGSVNPNGAVTGRATHSRPNIGQVPSTRAYYGKEARALFTVPENWVLMGSDASGLELRCLAHRMFPWDKGKYVKLILEGDVHTANQLAAGLKTRDEAKTFIYAFIYGGGSQLLGSIQLPSGTEQQQMAAGTNLKKSFLRKTPALGHLQRWIASKASSGYLKGLDGRHIFVRSPHSALNAQLQSDGALICKRWNVLIDRYAKTKGLTHGWEGDYAQCAWVHDEVQIACRTREIAEKLGMLSKKAIQQAAEDFKFHCPLDSDFSIGINWSETH